MIKTCFIWHYRHLGSPPVEPSCSDDSAKVSLPTQHLQESSQNVAGVMLDSVVVEASDLTIIASPTASDKDVDATVEQTCEKINLTASNVRSIIRVSSICVVIFAPVLPQVIRPVSDCAVSCRFPEKCVVLFRCLNNYL